MKQQIIHVANIRSRRPHSNVRGGPLDTHTLDVAALEHDLRVSIAGEVRFDAGSQALYATDASHYRQVPIGIVIPKTVADVVTTVAICRRYGAPLLARGAGTGLAGQTCNVAVVIDFSKYLNQIVELDPQRQTARVQPGIILDHLRAAAEAHHLTFGPDPATHSRCTLGGMIGNDSCGVHSVMAGKTIDNIEALEILTYDGLRLRVGPTSDEELARIIQAGGRRGAIYAQLRDLRDRYADEIRRRFPTLPRRVSGYNLDQLLPENGFNVARALVGSEGTCVTILEATTRLVHSPAARVLLVLGYPDAFSAADHVPEILTYRPIGLEGIDQGLIDDMRDKKLHVDDLGLLPPGGGWLLVEFGADTHAEAVAQAHGAMATLAPQHNAPHMQLFATSAQMAKIWDIRESGLGAQAFVPGKGSKWDGWEDSAVAPVKLGAYLRDLDTLARRYGYSTDYYGHYGEGCVHTRFDFDFATGDGVKRYDDFMHEAADLVVSYGGSLSGEHGDGQARAELLPKMFGDEIVQAFREFKVIWDPEWQMNPGKVVNAYRMTDNLIPAPQSAGQTHFAYRDDQGSFAHATQRCVGVGKCRRTEGGTMCPSFMATREEADSTRGRAHLLNEMLQGDPITGGWRDEQVKAALDLCLSCKACKSECPVNVDMATYKAEFLAHYYEGRARPASAYVMGWIYWWARLAAIAPELANFATHAPGLSRLVKALGGIAPQRQMPRFAPQTFKHWFQARGPRNIGAPQVLLWPDTFNNHMHPATAIAAVEVLEAAGYQVIVPEQSLCCGRPLYDFGMLDTAKHLLRQILATLQPEIAAGIPVVVLEPSCAAVFRDELLNLFPDDEDARRLSQQTFLLSEFLMQQVADYQPPQLHRQAVVHGHCHHKSLMKMTDEVKLLKKIGIDYRLPDSGCCGMAGAFGFEQAHYDVSIACGERVLLPAVRAANAATLIIADGFSCREQIAQTTDRQALHIAQVIQMAMYEGQDDTPTIHPAQRAYLDNPTPALARFRAAAFIGAGVGVAVGGGMWAWRRLTRWRKA